MGALAELEKRLQNTSGLIAQYENALASPENIEHKNSLSVSIRSLQKLQRRLESEFLELAAIEEQEVYRYRIIETGEPPTLGGVADAWAHFEKLFAAIYLKLAKRDMPNALGYSYCFAGSVGVVVTLPKLPQQVAALLSGNPIDDTSEIVFDLIESKNIIEIINSLGPEPIKAMNDWLAVHLTHHYGLGLEWKSNRETRRIATIPYDKLSTLQTSIADMTTTTTLILDGVLQGADIIDKTFKIATDEGDIIEGKFEDAITADLKASLPGRYRATITKTTQIVQKTKKEKPITYFLERLSVPNDKTS